VRNFVLKFALWVFTLNILAILLLLVLGGKKISTYSYDKMGDYFFWLRNYEEAIESWERASTPSTELKTLRKIGITYLIEGKREEGIRFHIKALKKYPEDPFIRFNLALLYLQEEKLEDSLREVEKILSRYPGFPHAHYLKGLVYEKKGEEEKAYQEFMQELNNNPGCAGAWGKIEILKKE